MQQFTKQGEIFKLDYWRGYLLMCWFAGGKKAKELANCITCFHNPERDWKINVLTFFCQLKLYIHVWSSLMLHSFSCNILIWSLQNFLALSLESQSNYQHTFTSSWDIKVHIMHHLQNSFLNFTSVNYRMYFLSLK